MCEELFLHMPTLRVMTTLLPSMKSLYTLSVVMTQHAKERDKERDCVCRCVGMSGFVSICKYALRNTHTLSCHDVIVLVYSWSVDS